MDKRRSLLAIPSTKGLGRWWQKGTNLVVVDMANRSIRQLAWQWDDGTFASAKRGSLDEPGLATKAERRLSGAPTLTLHKRAERSPLTDSSTCAKRCWDCIESRLGMCALRWRAESSNTRERSNVEYEG